MKFIKIILVLFFIAAAVVTGLYFVRPDFFNRHETLFASDSAMPIQLDDNAKMHFFRNGFAVTSGDTKFFTYDGAEMSLPFAQQDLENMGVQPIINMSTDNYVLVNNRYIYSTSKIPFELVYEIPEEFDGWDIKELDDMLLFVLKDSNNQLKPQLLKKGDYIPADLSGMEHSSFLDASYGYSNKLISILTIATDTPNPSTRVFYFADGNSPFGVLSLDDAAFYKIYNVQNRIALIGIHQIMCYNIDGSLMWSLHGPNSYIHQHAGINSELLLYFNKARFNKANAVYINENGDMETMVFPSGLTSIQAYKDGYILALDKRNIAVISRKGSIDRRYALNISPTRLYWTPFSPNNMYVIDRNNLLHTYILGKSGTRKDENT